MDKTIHMMARLIARIDRARRGFGSDCRGMAAIEMAFVFPFMVVLYFGLVDITNLLSAERRVTLASDTLADLVTQAPGTVSKADLTGFYNAVGPIMDPFPSSSVQITISDYRMNGTSVVQKWTNSKNGNCGSAFSTGNFSNLMTDGNDLVVARVCISYTPVTGKVFGAGPFTLSDDMILRPRQTLTIDCSDC